MSRSMRHAQWRGFGKHGTSVTVLLNGMLAAALVLTPVRVAHADWEYTRWEMTPEQVVAASSGTAVAPLDAGPELHTVKEIFWDALLRVKFTIAPGVDTDASFYFDD